MTNPTRSDFIDLLMSNTIRDRVALALAEVELGDMGRYPTESAIADAARARRREANIALSAAAAALLEDDDGDA